MRTRGLVLVLVTGLAGLMLPVGALADRQGRTTGPPAAKVEAERQAATNRAMEQARKRPLVDAGPPFGKLYLVDEIDCAKGAPNHGFVEDPAGASKVETILGRACRVLRKTAGEAAYFAYRIGRGKMLTPGAAYVLTVRYPEDAPRSMIVLNGGNETSRGFHTGATFGDALHTKYVDNLGESIRVPLSGRYESWKMLFNLHDRTPKVKFIRGAGLRALTGEDGFTVVIAQFSARDIPASKGAAVGRIRLFAVPDASKLDIPLRLPPEPLPQRHLFWREEMADGVISASRAEQRGLADPLDWYRYKLNMMRFLGMNTFSKDLLEFGACQHWDPTDGGGNRWVYFNQKQKGLWKRIVEMMGEAGMNVLPYYEYSGSKGERGLGFERRAKPLTRDDAYTHIKWIETANADITDPDTYADFKKMLDLTIVRHKDKARFVGAWIRPRMQLPMGFADATRERFARQANGGKAVTRKQLAADKALLGRYYKWWYGKRRQFLVAMRDHLRRSGVNNAALILYTACASEPGASFASWEKRIVTDDVAAWQKILSRPEHILNGRKITPMSIEQVVRKGMYLEALLAAPLNWGNWEVAHANPPADPANYKDTGGVLMTHAFNRAYTVADKRTFETFRGPSGLAIIRHYPLNEDMMFDSSDKPKLGYFVADIERAGPYCMLAEARAMAYGDPTHIGYLVGLNFGRGFPQYVRNFNAAFLSLPALPSKVVKGACGDPEVVVRAIETARHGTYLAVVNVALKGKAGIVIRLPVKGAVTDAATGEAIDAADGKVRLKMYPCQLRALHVK